MSLVKHTDKRSGITYVYESESYWDKEKQQPRSRRKLIGKIDPDTGEIVPTGGRGRKKKAPGNSADLIQYDDAPSLQGKSTEEKLIQDLKEKDLVIAELKERIRILETEKRDAAEKAEALLQILK